MRGPSFDVIFVKEGEKAMDKLLRPTRMEVSLEKLKRNFNALKNLLSDNTKVIAVIKADGYGSGVLPVYKTLKGCGVLRFAVATPDEAVFLRENGVEEFILVLGPSSYDAYPYYIENDIASTVYDYEQARALSDVAIRFGKRAVVHIKIDTGMGRLGFFPEDVELIVKTVSLPGLNCEGIYTHFSVADEDPEYTSWQYNRFVKLLSELEGKGIKFKIRHCCNSAATIAFPKMHLDAVRPGLVLYGMYPAPSFKDKIKLEPIFEVKTVLASIKCFPKESSIGYGRRYKTKESERIGVLPIGYADGYTRLFSGKVEVLIRGKRVPVVGNICMDQTMVSLEKVPDASVGDEVVLLGRQGQEVITPDELAQKLGTINYEIPNLFTSRVKRVYVG